MRGDIATADRTLLIAALDEGNLGQNDALADGTFAYDLIII
jgi:hypothetical protein